MNIDGAVRPATASGGSAARSDAVEQALAALLEAHATAEVAAIDALASPALVAVPASVGVASERIGGARTMPELVVPADRVVAAKLWGRAHRHGMASAAVRLEGRPERPGFLCLFDVRAVHGVMVVVFVDGSTEPAAALDADPLPARPPRFGRASKDAASAYRWIDAALSAMLGWAPEEIVGHRTVEYVHPDDQEVGVASWMEMLDAPGCGHRVRLRHRRRDGKLDLARGNQLQQALRRPW